MLITDAIRLLDEYNCWRRGADTQQLDPITIGKAIDTVLKFITVAQN